MAAANKGPKKRTKQLNISTIISGDGRPIRLGRVQEGGRSSAALPTSPVIDPHSDSGSDEGNMPTQIFVLWLRGTGSVLCRIALWDCLGDEIWSNFPRNLYNQNRSSVPPKVLLMN